VTPATDLRGSIVPLVTPFADGEVDLAAFEEAVERQVLGGSHGIVVTGTSGEPTSLSPGERAQLFKRAVSVAARRITVVAATGSANHGDTLALTGQAQTAGADAVLILTPAFVKPSQAGLVRHFTGIAAATDLPMLIYNIPGRAGVAVSADTVERVADASPNLVGLKHASNDLDLVTDLLLRLGDNFRLFCGLESYSYPFLAVGGAGLMSAVGNLLPVQVAELCNLVEEGDHQGALRLHRALFRINQAVFFDTNPGPLKAMLSAMGLGSDELRPPLAPLPEAVLRRVLEALDSVEAFTAKGTR
jgi:4-hydroxy-tetrahydrodipicolinate synthase